MKATIESLIQSAFDTLKAQGEFPQDTTPRVQIDRTKDKQFGDFATNAALMNAKPAGMPPRKLAEMLVAALPANDNVTKVDIAGPGFINFTIGSSAATAIVNTVLEQKDGFGRSAMGGGKKVHIEFVSANPTGPLHVGHGRGAAIGAAVADLLETAGYDVHREYYVNDAGRQMHILAASVWLRYLELIGEKFTFPSNGYKGDYVEDIAKQLYQEQGTAFHHTAAKVFDDIPADADDEGNGDKDAHIDALVDRCRDLLGPEGYNTVFQAGLVSIRDDICDDLAEFSVRYQEWFSEQSLTDSQDVEKAVAKLKAADHLYEENGALWFKSSAFGDEKDRVVMRANGQYTYFASDIAYHMNKLDRGYDQIVDIWGADHHGYIPRVKAAMQALGADPEKLKVLLVQFAILYRGEERVQMSTRSGSFVTLRELRDEVGNDAARFFYVMRKSDQHMDFDLDLAKSQSNDNPMYYIQYAHARICSVFRQLGNKELSYDEAEGLANLARLDTPQEKAIMDRLPRYPEIIESAAQNYEPHQIAHFLRELANDLHSYYNAHKVIDDNVDQALRNARLSLMAATRVVLANGLKLLGVSAPEEM
ncbi:MAG: arginine--tRNA ligase [Kangiellaceae bacterium]|nr:arginine--tRNA ligase [Kangiellaceae bacterium]|tara:strand:- start:2835 stop:4607 length:1773 start_codon:yes stop_codon:yes gene_type:complete